MHFWLILFPSIYTHIKYKEILNSKGGGNAIACGFDSNIT